MPLNIFGFSISLKVADAPAARAESADRGLHQLYKSLWAAGVRGMPTGFEAADIWGWVLFYMAQVAKIERLESELQSRIREQRQPALEAHRLPPSRAKPGDADQSIRTLQADDLRQADRIKMLEADLNTALADLSQAHVELDHLSRLVVQQQEQLNAQAGGGQPKKSAK